jgi:hypothetical protein
MSAKNHTPGVLLLTAAIDTDPGMRNNQRSNSDLRRGDYKDGLKHYFSALPPEIEDILFCENTGADLTDFESMKEEAARAGRRLHIRGFKGQTPASLGKGVCEFEILDVANRWLAERFPDETPVWKITGRLILRNVSALIRSRPENAEVYVDMRSVPLIGEKLGGNDWAEMRMICYTIGAYQRYLQGKGPSCGYVTEKGLFRLLQEVRAVGANVQPRFRVQPRFSGICGGSNKDYQSLEYQLKDGVRAVSRVVVPGLWL